MWDSDTCTCRCRESKECTTGTYFDPNTCSCQEVLFITGIFLYFQQLNVNNRLCFGAKNCTYKFSIDWFIRFDSITETNSCENWNELIVWRFFDFFSYDFSLFYSKSLRSFFVLLKILSFFLFYFNDFIIILFFCFILCFFYFRSLIITGISFIINTHISNSPSKYHSMWIHVQSISFIR